MACSVEVIGISVAAGAASSLGGQRLALKVDARRSDGDDGQDGP